MIITEYINDYLKNGNYRGIVSKLTRVSNKNLLIELDKFLLDNSFNIDFKNTSQKIYSVINSIKDNPKCYCGKLLKYKNLSLGYLKYCSKKCQSTSYETIKKSKLTNLNKYGKEHHSKRISYRKLISDKNKKGIIGFGSDKYKKTIYDRYGVNNISDLNVINYKKSKTWRENWRKLSIEDRCEIISERSKKYSITVKNKFYETFNSKWKGRYKIKNSNIYRTKNSSSNRGLYTILCLKCNNEFKILKSSLYHRVNMGIDICTLCNPYRKNTSIPESDIYSFISENYKHEIIKNDYKILNNKELDIYIPGFKLGIEYNGLYWHSELYKDNNYHLDKTNKCLDKGIYLIHIFEDEWLHKYDIVKSNILNLLNISIKIYASECVVVDVDNIINFLDTNYIDGYIEFDIGLGLYYNDKLVSVMTFSRNEHEYELLVYCNILNTTVVGGGYKLFNYFIDNYNTNTTSILCKVDRRWSNGDLFKKLGFNFLNNTDPNYYYIESGIRTINNNTNNSNKIFDCGHSIYRYINKK